MVALTNKVSEIDTALENLRGGKIDPKDMESLAKNKYKGELDKKGYGYLHDFAKNPQYHGSGLVSAKIAKYLKDFEKDKEFVSKMQSGSYKSLHVEQMPPTEQLVASITMTSASTYAKDNAAQDRVNGMAKKFAQEAAKLTPVPSLEEVTTFVTTYPLLAGMAAAKPVVESEVANLVSYGSTGKPTTATQEYQQLALLQSTLLEAAFDPQMKEEARKALLDNLNDKAHAMYNDGKVGLPKKEAVNHIRKELTDEQKTGVIKEVKEAWVALVPPKVIPYEQHMAAKTAEMPQKVLAAALRVGNEATKKPPTAQQKFAALPRARTGPTRGNPSPGNVPP